MDVIQNILKWKCCSPSLDKWNLEHFLDYLCCDLLARIVKGSNHEVNVESNIHVYKNFRSRFMACFLAFGLFCFVILTTM